jgi:hypothetical protein
MAINDARRKVASHINATMTQAYWQIGKHIVEYEQGGQAKVAYCASTLSELSRLLTARLGRGFSRPNLVNMRKFYLLYPNCQSVTDILSWTHGIILSHYKDDLLVEYATYGLNTNLFVSKYDAGMFYEGDRAMFVSSGVSGVVPFRLGVPPEIVVITLKKKR